LIAFGDASTLQINVTSVARGAPTSWLGTFEEIQQINGYANRMNGGFVPVSEDELQKRGKEKNKQKHQASSFIIGFVTERVE
jgi:hypothetical protein